MPYMAVQRAGHNYSVNIFHIEQPPVIVKRLNAGDAALGLIAAPAINISHGNNFNVMHAENLPQQIIAAITHANHADANAVICPEHSRTRIRQHCRSDRRLLQKCTSRLICHDSPRKSGCQSMFQPRKQIYPDVIPNRAKGAVRNLFSATRANSSFLTESPTRFGMTSQSE
jgi:hypothetical protein